MIKIGKTEIHLNLNVQTSTEGRPFRLSGVSKKGEGKWISGNLKSHWVYSFKYLDDGTFFTIEIDYDDKVLEFIYMRDKEIMKWYDRTILLPGETRVNNTIQFICEHTGVSTYIVSNTINKYLNKKNK